MRLASPELSQNKVLGGVSERTDSPHETALTAYEYKLIPLPYWVQRRCRVNKQLNLHPASPPSLNQRFLVLLHIFARHLSLLRTDFEHLLRRQDVFRLLAIPDTRPGRARPEPPLNLESSSRDRQEPLQTTLSCP